MTTTKAPPQPTLDRDYVSVQQAAAYLQVHPQTIMGYLKADTDGAQ